MKPIATSSNPSSKCLEFNIASFNILAESYLSPRSHPGLPPSYADVAFDAHKRRRLLVHTLQRFCDPSTAAVDDKWDILALQELDLLSDDEGILPALKSWGYEVVHTATDQRRDCCAIVFDKRKFRSVQWEAVKFDDLATLYAQQNHERGEDTKHSIQKGPTFNNIKPNGTNSELTGMVRSFLRRNCGVLAHLETLDSNKHSILVSSVHLYWHPGYEYVKLCQAKYLLDRAHAMATKSNEERIPTIICGDMNSKPGSIVHQYFVKGSVDARSVAPWHYFWDGDNEVMYSEDDDRLDGQDAVDTSFCDTHSDSVDRNSNEGGNFRLEEQFQFCQLIGDDTDVKRTADGTSQDNLDYNTNTASDALNKNKEDISSNYHELQAALMSRRMNNHKSPQDYTHMTPTSSVKYMLDFTLNRFTRWLRILGIDARLETDEEERERTKGQKM
jgi:hypothetical protein